MTKEQLKLSYKNRNIAAKKLGLESGQALHHIDPSWRTEDIERYIQWNVEDLVIMEKGEHTALHNKLRNISEETRTKMSKAKKGKSLSDQHKKKIGQSGVGKHSMKRSEESKRKNSESHKGKTYSQETRDKKSNSMKGKNKGKHFYNNGIITIFSTICPDGFVSGRLKK